MKRLLAALAFGFGVFVGTFTTATAPFVLLRSGVRLGQVLNLLTVALVFGGVFSAGVLLVHAPVLACLRAYLGERLNRLRAATVGAALVPAPFILYLATFRDPDEDPGTLAGWLRLLTNVPGEFVLGILPFLLGSIAFAVAFGPKPTVR